MKLSLLTMATLTLVASASTTHAETKFGDYVTVSGFGTLGAVKTDTDTALFERDRQGFGGANSSGTLAVDSNFGLQATATANSWLSATVQVVTVRRQTESDLTTQAEWAFAKVTPLTGLSVRAGLMPIPMFMASDSINVGYANNWLRAPNEVYGLVSFRRLQGLDVTYQLPVGPTTLTVSALAGTSQAKSTSGVYDMKNVVGANVLLETEWATFRYGQVDANYGGLAGEPAYGFKGIGVSVDRNNIVFQAESVQRRAGPSISNVVDADGWYVMGGYRVGTFLPYVILGNVDPQSTTPKSAVASPQKSTTLGLRWDAFKSASLKAEVERIDTQGTKGISFTGYNSVSPNTPANLTSPVTVISASLDFVF